MEMGKVVELTAGIKVSSHTEGKLTVETEEWKLVKIELGVPGLLLTFEKEKRKK